MYIEHLDVVVTLSNHEVSCLTSDAENCSPVFAEVAITGRENWKYSSLCIEQPDVVVTLINHEVSCLTNDAENYTLSLL